MREDNTCKLSRSLRARGLKFVQVNFQELVRFVALFTGAWIEIEIFAAFLILKLRRALYGRVD